MRDQIIHKAELALIYQDWEEIQVVLKQIESLNISHQAIPLNAQSISKLVTIEPKIILISTTHLISSAEFYLEFLEKFKSKIPVHYSVLLTNNKESQKAFIACESGLFDNYVITNPLNEPYRLPLILMQSLKLISEKRGSGITKLIAEGNENLVSCIEQGAELKNSLKAKLDECESAIKTVQKKPITSPENQQIGKSIEDAINSLSAQVNTEFVGFFDKLNEVKSLSEKAIKCISNEEFSADRKLEMHNDSLPLNDVSDQAKHEINSEDKKYKLLIGDCSELFNRVVRDIFEKSNFIVRVSHTGQETIDVYTEFEPDIVVLEYSFPDLDGIEVTKKIRQFGGSTPIVVLSSNKDKAIVKKWVPYGIGAYIVKPSTQKTILDTVVNELKHPTNIIRLVSNNQDIKWLPEFSVGNELMDSHHKQLFDIVNEYLHVNGNGKLLVETFEKLESYIKMHFKAEENILLESGYPNALEHIEKHRELESKLSLMKGKLNKNSFAMQEKVGVYLYKWLANHILKSDMHYKQYFDNAKQMSNQKSDNPVRLHS